MLSIDIPSNPVARRAWILFQLKLKGHTLGSLARSLGVSRNTTCSALHRQYPRMEAAIAKKLGLRPQQLWPERYLGDGTPDRPSGRKLYKHARNLADASRASNGKRRSAGSHARRGA